MLTTKKEMMIIKKRSESQGKGKKPSSNIGHLCTLALHAQFLDFNEIDDAIIFFFI